MAEINFEKLHETINRFASDFANNGVDLKDVNVKLLIFGNEIISDGMHRLSLGDIGYSLGVDGLTVKLYSLGEKDV
jgi:hypothetical protein